MFNVSVQDRKNIMSAPSSTTFHSPELRLKCFRALHVEGSGGCLPQYRDKVRRMNVDKMGEQQQSNNNYETPPSNSQWVYDHDKQKSVCTQVQSNKCATWDDSVMPLRLPRTLHPARRVASTEKHGVVVHAKSLWERGRALELHHRAKLAGTHLALSNA